MIVIIRNILNNKTLEFHYKNKNVDFTSPCGNFTHEKNQFNLINYPDGIRKTNNPVNNIVTFYNHVSDISLGKGRYDGSRKIKLDYNFIDFGTDLNDNSSKVFYDVLGDENLDNYLNIPLEMKIIDDLGNEFFGDVYVSSLQNFIREDSLIFELAPNYFEQKNFLKIDDTNNYNNFNMFTECFTLQNNNNCLTFKNEFAEATNFDYSKDIFIEIPQGSNFSIIINDSYWYNFYLPINKQVNNLNIKYLFNVKTGVIYFFGTQFLDLKRNNSNVSKISAEYPDGSIPDRQIYKIVLKYENNEIYSSKFTEYIHTDYGVL